MAQRSPSFTYAEYRAVDDASELKHEYVNGQIVAMSGGTLAHAALKTALTLELGLALRGRPCRPYDSDARVRVPATGRATYPDLTVICGEAQFDGEDRDALTNPTALFEVLSKTTERSDRGEKFAHYQRLPSLRHYVLVSQTERRVEVYTRREAESWEYHAVEAGLVKLSAIGVDLDLTALYADPLVQRGLGADEA